jgi:hypothetical protein
VSTAVHFCTQCRREEPGLSGTDLGESFGYCLHGTVVLDESTTLGGSRALSHVPFVRQQLGHSGHPLRWCGSSELLAQAVSKGIISSFQHCHGRRAAVSPDDIIKELGKRRFVSSGKQRLTGGAQTIGEGWSAHPSMLPLILHQRI